MASASTEQIKMLLQYMQEHNELARGHLIKSVGGKVCAKALWSDLAKQLNATGGAVKTVLQWQKVWADRKYLSKKAAAAARRSASDTGGGTAAPQLTDEQEAIRLIMGEDFELSKTKAVVHPFPTIDENKDRISPFTIEENLQSTQEAGTSSTRLTEGNQRRRYRWRNVRRQNFRSFLLESEAKNRAELAGIRHELSSIKNTLQDLVVELRHIRQKL